MTFLFRTCLVVGSALPTLGMHRDMRARGHPAKLPMTHVSYGKSDCPCVGIAGVDGTINVTINDVPVAYPSDVGTRCEAWDDERYTGLCESGGEPGSGQGWCAQKWCYVDPCACEGSTPKEALYEVGATYRGQPLYYSYDTCGSDDTYPAALAGRKKSGRAGKASHHTRAKKANVDKVQREETNDESAVQDSTAEAFATDDSESEGEAAHPEAAESTRGWSDAGAKPGKANQNSDDASSDTSITSDDGASAAGPPSGGWIKPKAAGAKPASSIKSTSAQNQDPKPSEGEWGSSAKKTVSKSTGGNEGWSGKETNSDSWSSAEANGKDSGDWPEHGSSKDWTAKQPNGQQTWDASSSSTSKKDGSSKDWTAKQSNGQPTWDASSSSTSNKGAADNMNGPEKGTKSESGEKGTSDIADKVAWKATDENESGKKSAADDADKVAWKAADENESGKKSTPDDADKVAWKAADKNDSGKKSTPDDADKVAWKVADESESDKKSTSGVTDKVAWKAADSANGVVRKRKAVTKDEQAKAPWDYLKDHYKDTLKKDKIEKDQIEKVEKAADGSMPLEDASKDANPTSAVESSDLPSDDVEKPDVDTAVDTDKKDDVQDSAGEGKEEEKDNSEDDSDDKHKQDSDEAHASETEESAKAVCSKLKSKSSIDEKATGKASCMCIGISTKQPGSLELRLGDSKVNYPADVGSSCSEWDQDAHPECISDGSNKLPAYCQEAWCYVDPCSCDQKQVRADQKKGYLPSARYQAKPLFYSYQTCGAVDHWTEENNKAACSNMKSEDDCKGDCMWVGKTCKDQVEMSVCGLEQEQKSDATTMFSEKVSLAMVAFAVYSALQ